MSSKLASSYSGITNGLLDGVVTPNPSWSAFTACHVLRVGRIDKDARCDERIGSTDLLGGKRVHPGVVEYLVDVVVLVDHHHREVPVSWVGNGDE